MGLKTVKWLTISQFELREGRALRQTPSRRLQVLVSEHALRQTKLTPESHHRIACVTVRSEKQRRYPCSGPQPTQWITGSAFQISFYPDWQIDRGFFQKPIMACRQILAPLVHNWRPRTEFQRCFADGCNQILVASVAHDNQCINSYYASIEKVLSELELRFSGNDQEILFASALSPAEASLCCRAGRLGRKKKRAHGARREASAKETGVALRIICHSETPDKECFSHVAKFYKIDGEILKAKQKMCATFRRVRIGPHNCPRNAGDNAREWSIWYVPSVF